MKGMLVKKKKRKKKEINKNGPKHGTQNQKAQGPTTNGPTIEKREKMRLKAQKEISTKSCTKHQKGRKYIYVKYI